MNRASTHKEQSEQKPGRNDLKAVSRYLKTHKTQKDDTYKEVEEYLINMANEGNEFAQIEYGRLLQRENKDAEANAYFQKAVEHSSDPRVKQTVELLVAKKEYKNRLLETGQGKALLPNTHENTNATQAAAAKQAKIITNNRRNKESAAYHRAYIPPKNES